MTRWVNAHPKKTQLTCHVWAMNAVFVSHYYVASQKQLKVKTETATTTNTQATLTAAAATTADLAQNSCATVLQCR